MHNRQCITNGKFGKNSFKGSLCQMLRAYIKPDCQRCHQRYAITTRNRRHHNIFPQVRFFFANFVLIYLSIIIIMISFKVLAKLLMNYIYNLYDSIHFLFPSHFRLIMTTICIVFYCALSSIINF